MDKTQLRAWALDRAIETVKAAGVGNLDYGASISTFVTSIAEAYTNYAYTPEQEAAESVEDSIGADLSVVGGNA